MALKIKRAGADEYGRTLKLLLAGDPGSGKTRLASTFPNVFYANADAGMMSVVDRKVPFIDVAGTDDLTQLLTALRQAPKQRQQMLGAPVSTVVIDTLDSIQKILIEERKREIKKDALAIADWGWLGDQLRVLIKNFRNLELNVIFTCHLKTVEDGETGQTFVKAALQGQMGDEIPAYVDVCGLLRASPTTVVKDGKPVRVLHRVLQTGPDARHPWLKDRSGKLPVDFDVDLDTDGPKLLKIVYGGLTAEPSEVVVTEQTAPVEAEPVAEKVEEKVEAEVQETVTGPVSDSAETVQRASNETEELAPAAAAAPAAAPAEPTPAPEPVVQAAEEVVASADAGNGKVDDEMTCQECGDPIESEDQRDLSLIRFRKRLDRKCFLSAKKART